MKTLGIVIAIGLVLTALFFFSRDKGSRADLAEAQKEINTVSNKFSTTETKLMFVIGESNKLGQQFTKQADRITSLSNQVVKLNESLQKAQQEHATARTDLEKQTRKANDGDLRITELDSELRGLRKTLESRDADIARLRDAAKQTEADMAQLHDRLQKAEADVVRWQLDMNDAAALQAQLKRLKQQYPPNGFATPPTQATNPKGATGLTARVDTKATGYHLQIQPDGSVKLVPPLEAVGAAR